MTTSVVAEGITVADLAEFWTAASWLIWFGCLIAILRIVWLGGLLYEARKSGNSDGIEGIVAQLIALCIMSSAAGIATALLS
ncbi:hypothetical protein DFR67_12646 [Williamsia limnetica]|uniref:Uncharacterized protein n=1 Tax=Williamsia limnetica TaxID=882452 RepID=A0A318RG21_WILLI|nr:hypothetical protein [Williamsia limnetica]PYE12038.1 hypothetical protein DFR67_12646 [Williamsia limnetica]